MLSSKYTYFMVSPSSPSGYDGRPSRRGGLPAEAPKARRPVGGDGLEPPTSCV
jgi:hypothetical protein